MENTLMNLKILLPDKVFADLHNVNRIVFETKDGNYGLLPQRLDCTAALVPGIFTYEIENKGIHYVAIGEGILVKAGRQVFVSIRKAIEGEGLGRLKELVKEKFEDQSEKEKLARSLIAKIESQLIHNLEEFRSR